MHVDRCHAHHPFNASRVIGSHKKNPAHLAMRGGFSFEAEARCAYTENEEPQPQVVVALGLRMTNCAPSMSSL